MSQQQLGEQVALLDLDGNGIRELFLFPAATRSYDDPMQQAIAVFSLSSSFSLVPQFDLINVNGKIRISPSSTAPSFAKNITTGWLQEAVVTDFNRDGISDLLLAGHGRELPVTQEEAAKSDGLYRAGFWPNDFLQLILSSDPSRPIYLPERKTAFWHSAGAGDLNGDGYVDIVAANLATYKHQPVEILLGNGSGAFKEITIDNPIFWTPSVSNDPRAFAVAIVDIGGFSSSGKDSLVVGRGQALAGSDWENTHVLVIDYQGTSWSVRERLALDLSDKKLKSVTAKSKDIWLDQIAVNDVNGDGKDDIFGKFVTLDWDYVATVAFVSSNGGYRQIIVDANNHLYKNNFGGKGPSLYDVNGDGFLDIVNGDFIFPGEDNAVMSSFIFLGDGKGNFIQLSEIWNMQLGSDFRNINWFKAVENDGNILFCVRRIDGQLTQISLIELNNLPTIENIRNHLASPPEKIGDDIKGTSLNDRLSGGVNNDRIFGLSGSDIIIAGLGNDTIDGGDGTDFVYFSSVHQDYVISLSKISDKTLNRDGTDFLTNVERLRFAD